MNQTHQIQHSWYMKSAAMAPTLSDAEQTTAFETFAAARHALRTQLHECEAAAQRIVTRAKAAASGAKGTKNDAKKYFHPGVSGPTKEKVEHCEATVGSQAFSDALHALGGKQALYDECLAMASDASTTRTDAAERYACELKSRKANFFKTRGVLVTNNLRLAASVITKMGVQSMAFEDLMQHGAIGIQKAVEGFNPSQGTKFSTYAVPVIKGEIIRTLENFSHEVRLPSHVWTKMREYKGVEEDLTLIFGRTPTPVEIAFHMGVTVQEAVQMQQYHWDPISLQSPIGSPEDNLTLEDTLIDYDAQIPGEGLWDHAA